MKIVIEAPGKTKHRHLGTFDHTNKYTVEFSCINGTVHTTTWVLTNYHPDACEHQARAQHWRRVNCRPDVTDKAWTALSQQVQP